MLCGHHSIHTYRRSGKIHSQKNFIAGCIDKNLDDEFLNYYLHIQILTYWYSVKKKNFFVKYASDENICYSKILIDESFLCRNSPDLQYAETI